VARTRDRICDVALAAFGTRGFEATSLDALGGELGVTKQTVLYWFPSKVALLEAVIARAADELGEALDAALATARPGLERMDAVMRVVFRFAVRRPELLGLVREAGRLGPDVADHVGARLAPLVDRAVALLAREMDAGTIRRADPRLTLLFVYATVVGVATEAEAIRAVGLQPGPATLARLRRELFAYVRAALGAPAGDQPSARTNRTQNPRQAASTAPVATRGAQRRQPGRGRSVAEPMPPG
jgi:TetR/AcrR family transcriptional regulator